MYLARSDRSFPFSLVAQGSVVTIGAFDGLHLGHQQLLDRVVEEAVARELPAVVMSFEPTPKEYFSPQNPPGRLTRFREKYDALKRLGIDVFYCPNFNAAMRNIAADAFVRTLLVHALNVRHLVIGDDFVFARNREGNLAQLQRASRALGFSVEKVSSVVVDGGRVSSTAIRDALREGEMQRAEQLLGMRYRMSGKITSWNRELSGESIAFVNLQRRQSAVSGLFAAKIVGIEKTAIDAVAGIAHCGTDGIGSPCFGLYMPEFNQDLTGRRVDVEFIEQISDVATFETVEKLAAHLRRYAAEAQQILIAC